MQKKRTYSLFASGKCVGIAISCEIAHWYLYRLKIICMSFRILLQADWGGNCIFEQMIFLFLNDRIATYFPDSCDTLMWELKKRGVSLI